MKTTRIVNRSGQKARLKQLQQTVKVLERHASQEFKRGYELGGLAMKQAIAQAHAELSTGHAAEPPMLTKLDGE